MASAIKIPFLGRQRELDLLEARCADPGLTIVKGPPRIGKTTLLKHFVDRSRAADSRRVGMAESGEAEGDVLLRAIKDAYDHWRQKEGFVAEIKSIHAQIKGRLITTVGTALGQALGEFAGPGKDLVKLFFSGLDEARRMTETGGLQLPRLTSEEARDLLMILAQGQTAPVVIALNQWEEGQDLEKDTATLRSFLDNRDQWPACHVLLHLRDPRFRNDRNQGAKSLASGLHEFPGVKECTVDALNFEAEPRALENLYGWLVEHFPAFVGVTSDAALAERVLEEIAGNPAVLDEWAHLGEDQRSSLDALANTAANARAMRFPELREIYRKLLDRARQEKPILELALLAAVLPLPPDPVALQSVLSAVMGDATEDDRIYLASEGLFRPQDGSPLAFGHPSRREAAARCVLGLNEKHEKLDPDLAPKLKPYLQAAVTRVVPAVIDLFSPAVWNKLSEETTPAAVMIVVMKELVETVGVDGLPLLLCQAVTTQFKKRVELAQFNGCARFGTSLSPSGRLVLAKGLFNVFYLSGLDFARANVLLEELRALAKQHPGDAAVRELLAKGLVNAFFLSGLDFARTDVLLGDLRALAEQHPDDAAVREPLAAGLNNAVSYSGSNFVRADVLLGELRALAEQHPDDAAVREWLAKGLVNAVDNSGSNFVRADVLLGELRTLAEKHPDDAAVREWLAKGLVNAVDNSGSNFVRADVLLGELRTLAEKHPDDAAVREWLANAYGASVDKAAWAGDAERTVAMAEAMVPLRDVLLSRRDQRLLFMETFSHAFNLVFMTDRLDLQRRLRAAFETLFE